MTIRYSVNDPTPASEAKPKTQVSSMSGTTKSSTTRSARMTLFGGELALDRLREQQEFQNSYGKGGPTP